MQNTLSNWENLVTSSLGSATFNNLLTFFFLFNMETKEVFEMEKTYIYKSSFANKIKKIKTL